MTAKKISIVVFFLCIISFGKDSTDTNNKFLTWLKGDPDSPYKLDWGLDVSMASSSISLRLLSKTIKSNFVRYTPEDLKQFSKNDVNTFDRSAIGPIIDGCETWSFITNGINLHYVWLLLIGKEGRRDFTKILVMYFQAYLMYPLATRYTQSVIARKRPYFYSEEEDVEKRLSISAQTSFISGHANYGFCHAVLFSNLFCTYYPESPLKYVIWPLCLSTASATCLIRYFGHQHYPTDLLAGALTGSFMGWFIHFTHKKKVKKNISIEPILGEALGIRVSYKLLTR